MSRNDFGGLLDAMARAGRIEIEEAEFQKSWRSNWVSQGEAERGQSATRRALL